MKTRKNHYLKLGIFVLAGCLLFFVAIFLIGKQKKLFGNTFTLKVNYRSIEGLSVGNNVRFSGINVGIVDDIEILNDTTVQVSLLIDEKVRKFIKSDSKAAIGSNGLMGDRVININPGTPSGTEVNDGGSIAAVQPFNMDELIEPLRQTAENAREISNDIATISGNIRQGKGTIGRLFTDENMADDVSSTLGNINKASEKLDENMEAMRGNFLLRGYFKRKERKRKEREEKQREQKEDKSDKKDRKK